MALVPSGRFVRMQTQQVKTAQSLNDPSVFKQKADGANAPQRDQIEQQELGGGANPAAGSAAPEQPNQQPPAPGAEPGATGAADPQVAQDGVENQQEQDENDIAGFLVTVLANWGWPERTLSKYKENMVSEKLQPDGVGGVTKNISITIPNTYYGQGSAGRIKEMDYMKLIAEIQNRYHIRWQKGDRSGVMMSLSFTSEAQNAAQDPAEQQLERVYGKPSGKGAAPGAAGGGDMAKAASTMGEMLKMRKDELYNTMRNITKKG